MPDEIGGDIQRVRDEVAERLRRAGIATTRRDTPEELVRLLDAVEEFERTVQRKGGDLMVDEPVGRGRPAQPDDRSFVLPARADDEPIDALIHRIGEAQGRASRTREM